MSPKRRGKGEGSLFQTKHGTWRGYVTLDDGRRKYVSAPTQREGREKLRALQRAKEDGRKLGQPDQTLAQFLTYWLEQIIKPYRAPATYTRYETACRCYLIPTLGHIKLSALTGSHVQKLLNELADGVLAGSTVNVVRMVLAAALSYAQKHRIIQFNAAREALPAKVEKRQRTPLTAAQVKRLLTTVEGHRHQALYTLAVRLGLRKSELLDLRWADVDFDAGTLYVRKSKTDAGVRTLPLSASLVAVLRAHWAYQQDERLARGLEWKESGRVFPSERGTRLGTSSLQDHFKRSLQAAGLPDIRFHDLRHTCASLLVQAGVPLKTVSDVLGHTNITITADVYAHVYQEDTRSALAVLDKLTG